MRHNPQFDGRVLRSASIVSNVGGTAKLLVGFALALLLCAGVGAWGEQNNAPTGGSSSPPVTRGGAEDGFGPPTGVTPALQERMAQRRNNDRQRMLMADADKLLLLAQQLHEEVAKSNKDELSVPVMKKSEEIEKLAKSVKEKMRGY